MLFIVNSFGDVFFDRYWFLSMSQNRRTFVDLYFGLLESVIWIVSVGIPSKESNLP